MKNLIRLTDLNIDEIYEIFKIADEIRRGKHRGILKGKCVLLFFPETSIRTRITFEKGVYLLGGQPILFSPETLEKKEDSKDIFGYLNNWADTIVIRHRDMGLIEKFAQFSKVPVINAMTDFNHPCEVLADMYALSKIRRDFTKDRYLFCGEKGNIGLAWKEASAVMGFELYQCCKKGYEMDDVKAYHNIYEAIIGKDIICTDSLSARSLEDFSMCRISREVMEMANEGAVLNPCPPFYRGEEVSEDVIESVFFVGYEFKKYLLEVQQAIIIYCMTK